MGLNSIVLSPDGDMNAAAVTADSDFLLSGKVLAIGIDVGGTTPDLDVDVTTVASSGRPAQTLFTKDNVTADVWAYPRLLVQDTAGADLGTDAFTEYVFDNQIVRVQGENATNADATLTVTIIMEC